jgi:UDP-N-acetylmuramate dehydrogenase
MKIQENYSLKSINSYGIDSYSRYFSAPTTTNELIECINWAEKNSVPRFVLGGGYNLLVKEGIIDCLVICTKHLNRYIVQNNDKMYSGAGVLLDSMIHYAIRSCLSGAENMSGIPGTIGGALMMNAGAFGTEIGMLTEEFEMLTADGTLQTIKGRDAGFTYRKTLAAEGSVILGGVFLFKQEDRTAIETRRSEILKRRAEKQPLSFPSCGSVFKRPEGHFAGELIERCCLKGRRIGGAMVSEKHANFIVNTGSATGSDVKNLIEEVKLIVLKETGVQLEEEVKYLGF